MINSVFTVMGLWIFVMIITFLVAGVFAFIASNDKSIGFLDSFSIALLELYICSIYVNFKINPEEYGYTRIEQEITEVSK